MILAYRYDEDCCLIGLGVYTVIIFSQIQETEHPLENNKLFLMVHMNNKGLTQGLTSLLERMNDKVRINTVSVGTF